MNKKPLVTSISQIIEVPCKNNNLTLAQRKILKDPLDNFHVRIDKPWNFYNPKNSEKPAFHDCFFEMDEGYEWEFITEAPLKIFFEITRVCNLRCKGCYIPDMNGDNMNIDNILTVIDDAWDCWVLSIQLLWWEPTLHPYFIDICKYIKSKWISVEAVSNWIRLDKEYVKKLVGIVDYLAISIDWTEETHNNFRGSSSSYSNAINGFRNLVDAWINTEVLMTINKLNILDIDKVFETVWKDPSKLYLKIMHLADKMPDFLKEICISREEIDELKIKAEQMWVWIQAPVADFKKEWSSSFFGCPWWILTWIIDTSWDVHKCLYIRDESEILWNVFQKSLKEIWSDTHEKIKRAMWNKCVNCIHKPMCGWFCTLWKAKKRYY